MQAISAEIQAQEEAYNTYMDSAAAIGLDSTWVSWLQNGGNLVQDVTTFDDELKEKANRYKELYDKAMDCKNAIADLKKTEKEYAEQMLSNIFILMRQEDSDFYKSEMNCRQPVRAAKILTIQKSDDKI